MTDETFETIRGMTDDERAALKSRIVDLIDAETKWNEDYPFECDNDAYNKVFNAIPAYVNGLLAARLDIQAARIAALEAEVDIGKRAVYDLNTVIIDFSQRVKHLETRQITPEVNALVERYHFALNSDNILFSRRSQRDYECAIGVLVIKLMEGDK